MKKQFFRRTLVLLLALAMLLTSLPIITLAADKGTTFTYSQGDIIGLGSYPQSEVTDETLKASLTSKAGSTDAWTSYNYYKNGVQSDFMKYTDIELGGEKYRGVYFTSYRPYYTGGDGEVNYQEDNGYNTSTIYWFKYEPILWQILSYDATTDTAVVLSKSTIDAQEYYDNYYERTIDGKTIYPNNYEYSNIRTWLNETFYNTAFTSTEKTAIVATTLDNSAFSTDYSEYDSNSTTDNVWLLSYDEAMTAEYGFATNNNDYIGNRTAYTTDYVKSQGIYVNVTNKCTSWRLRSAGYCNDDACNVYSDGYVNNSYFDVDYTGGGVRPALTLHLKSEIVPSCAHAFTCKTVSPTCEEAGYTLYTCTKCKATAKDEYTPASGHCFTGEARVDTNGKYSLHCSVCDKYLTPKTGDNYKAFGSYPQTEVTDATLKTKLTNKAGSTDKWTSYNYYINGKQSDFMKYTDIELGGEKYRGVYFTSYRPYYTGGDGEVNYQEDNGYNTSTIYWFKYEPILWQILSYDATTDTAVVLSKSTIDAQEYYDNYYERTIDGKTIYPNNYEYSNIRTWLNETFYNTAFTSTEKTAIVATTLDNSAFSTDYSEYDSNSTTDNVWLLSYDEAMTAEYGFATNNNDYIGNRTAYTTDYVKSQGIYVNVTNKCTSWRLRSAGYCNDDACNVYSDGYVNNSYFDVDYTGGGVRPALTLHLKSEIVPSCAHAFTDTVTPATCEKGGYTTHTCSKCGETTVDAKTSPLGHNFAGEARTASDGTVTRKCTRCDKYGTPATTTVTVDDIVAKVENTKKSTDIAGNKIVVSAVSVSASDVYASATGISIKDKDGKAVDSTKPLATGMKITLPSGDTVEIAVLGDIDSNGEVNVSDARLALRAAVKLDTLTGVYEIAAKVGHDQISVSEARLILRAAVKLDNPKDWLK